MPKQQCRNPRSSRLRLGAIVTIVLVLVAVTASAQASSTADTSTASQSQDPAVAMYATEYSVSTQEAARRLERIEPLHELMASIRETEAHRLAGWGIDHSPTFTGWVLLTGSSPAAATSTATAEANHDLEIRTGAAHTYDQLLQAKKGLYRIGSVGQVNNPSNNTSISDIISFTAVDMSTNAVEIGIDPPSLSDNPHLLTNTGPLGTTDETFKAQAAAFTTSIAPHINVAYTVVDGRDLSDTADLRGGQAMSTCTAGFTALLGSFKGILTAGHCSKTQTIKGVTLRHINGSNSVTADAQFLAVPSGGGHVIENDYHCKKRFATICEVRGRRARFNMIGDFVCHTGMNSGISCGTVSRIDFSPDYTKAGEVACVNSKGIATGCHDVFVRVEGDYLRQCKGDSGGPWYRHGIAYGLHKGGTGSSCTAQGVTAHFSAIIEVEEYLGASISTLRDWTIQ